MKALAGALLVLGALLGLWASGTALARQEAARDSCGGSWYAGRCTEPEPYPSDLDSSIRLMCDSLTPETRAKIEGCP